ncbi:MAG: 5-amino-6-(D-ribitylamino)uracil--L-tyrosine 4-hydroxyphenyl transferase CofH, partial [Hyphomicrobiaceae bacterium]
TYSRKVFIPLTKLCRDVCHYCTFAHPPRKGERAYLTPDEVIAIARAGQAAGCHEALFTLGDRPEARYRIAAQELAELGAATTLDYLAQMAQLVIDKTGLLPHLNPGIMSEDELQALRQVSVSQGIMLETASERLSQRGGPHFGSPDKDPAVRLATIAAAGRQGIPFTSGILIGIGETRRERIEALLALRDLHDRYGHIQEIIIQNFRAKPGTKMAAAPEPDLSDHLWTIAVARIVFGGQMNIQAPPNLQAGGLRQLVAAGINDWGGVSPVTPDHVNPEAPWPHLAELAEQTREAGKHLVQRLAIYPAYAGDTKRWVTASLRQHVHDNIDARGLARRDDWMAGTSANVPSLLAEDAMPAPCSRRSEALSAIIDRAVAGHDLGEADIVHLFNAEDDGFAAVVSAADALRRDVSGDAVTYVVNRNINYTNVCYFKCQFCAFSKGKMSENLRGSPYVLNLDEIERRVVEAWQRGAIEVCLQGGIHPSYTGDTYLEICRRIKAAVPDIHIHAFSPLEIWQGADTNGVSVEAFLGQLREAGLRSLPGTAAEILDDEVRALICPDKINTDQWLQVMETAHRIGLGSTTTIMFGHVDRPEHWARHLLRIRALQQRTGGFTEFVPLPFVPLETPIYLKHKSRPGPTYREAILMHAVPRLVLNPAITNIQTSWVKMGRDGAAACLAAGANDLGGTLMNETITRSAGATHGEEFPPEEMEALIRSIGRTPKQRTTGYATPSEATTKRSFGAPPIVAPVNTPAREFARGGD